MRDNSRPWPGRLTAGAIIAATALITATVNGSAHGSTGSAPIAVGVAARGTVLLTADRVFDGTRFLERQAVQVAGGKIVKIASLAEMRAWRGARIAVPGGTIMPGFIDTHTHHLANAVPPLRILQHGVTTARDLGGPLTPAAIDGRVQLRQVMSGPIITAKGGYPLPVFRAAGAIEVTGPDEARAAVHRLVDGGASVIAVSLEEGGELGAPWSLHSATSLPPWPTLTDADLAVVVAESHLLGRKVTAYLGTPVGVRRALNAGVDEWAHMPCDPLPADLIRRAGAAAVAITGTLDTLTRCAGVRENAEQLVAAGAKLLYGTDLGHTDIPHGIDAQEIHRELHTGKSVEQALASATSEAGTYLGLAPLGQIVPGAPADLIVINGDPRTNLKELEYPRVVMAGGKIVVSRLVGE